MTTFYPYRVTGLVIGALAALLVALPPDAPCADPPARKPAAAKIDFTQPELPVKPTPDFVKIIDQGTRDPRLKGYFTPEGIKVEIVAEEPAVVNPVGMTFADDGTPYVLEWRPSKGDEWRETPEVITYKDGSKRTIATMKKRVKDVVKVLRDTKGKGVYDKSEVILEDELPSSILLHDGWLYLSGRGTVRRFKQSKAGGPYDVKQVIAQGFCGFHHHQVSGMTIGNDGWLYLTSGDDDNYVEGSDGSRTTVLRTGAVFRCRPDGSKMHTFAIGFRNPYRDVAFDAAGNLFHADNDNEDGSKFTGCRLMHVAEGNDFGWRLYQGARCCKADRVRGAVYGELPGKVPPLTKTGRGAPAGLLIYNDTRFPEPYRGLLLYPDVFRKLVRAYHVEPRGATFAITHQFDFLKSNDPLFRPCQMVVGPDGAIYVVDWRTDSGGAGRLWGDGIHGRIYRLTWTGTKDFPALPPRPMDSWAKIAKLGDADLLKTLSSEEASDRDHARQELVKRGDKKRPALLKLLRDGEQPETARIAALGAVQAFWDADVQKAFTATLADGSADLRRLSADGLGLNAAKGDTDAHNALLKALNDDDLAVRRAAAIAMGRVAAPAAPDNLVNTLAFDDTNDVYLRDSLVRALESLGKPAMGRLLALAESGVKKDIDRVVETFTAMRTRPAYEALPRLLKNPHLSIAERAALVRSCTNYLLDPPISLYPILDYLEHQPREARAIKLAALEVVSTPGMLHKSRRIQDAAWLLELLDETDSGVRLSAIRAVEAARLALAGPRLAKIVTDATRPAAERQAVIKALRNLNDRGAAAALKEVLAAKPTAPQAAVRREAFLALAALDRPFATAAARKHLEKGDELLSESVQILGATADGTRFAARLYLDKKLPRELLPEVTNALRTHRADSETARLLQAVMKSGLSIVNNPAEVARIRKLVKARGNARRGRALYLNGNTVACIKCHRLEGAGGNVGPDLTRIWDTHSVEKILESIVEPNKEIKEGYQTYQATTKKGLVYTGLKVSQTKDEVVLRDANARDVRLRMKDVEELTASKQSLMPENVVSQLSFDEFLDLVAFLKDRKAQESLRGLALDFLVVGPFGPEWKKAYAPETKPDPKATYPGAKAGEVLRWQEARVEPSGLLNLRTIFSRDNVSIYALTYVHSAKAQKADLLLGSDGRVRVWLDGKLVHERAASRRARPDQDRVAVTLRPGWNAVLVKVANGPGDHGLYLRFAGEGLRVSAEGK